MSNEKGNEMTNNIDIDLESIPHPKDCHQVPVGATIPEGTPVWIVNDHGGAEWSPTGFHADKTICRSDFLYLTADPIAVSPAPPTPDDSPIIIDRTSVAGIEAGTLAMWFPGDQEWCATGKGGYSRWLISEEITEWSPAIVTKTRRGVWDERDKRDRVDANGDVWRWDDEEATWACVRYFRGNFGSLNALRGRHGDDCLTGFADEQGGEK